MNPSFQVFQVPRLRDCKLFHPLAQHAEKRRGSSAKALQGPAAISDGHPGQFVPTHCWN
jgi:hypothetical protein